MSAPPEILLVLASASPRRRELLARTGLRFQVRPAEVGEELEPGLALEPAARELALRKAEAALRALAGAPAVVLAADTLVGVEEGAGRWRLLGKPAGPAEARAVLATLSGSRHGVVTAVAVLRSPGGSARVASETTWVTMRDLAEEELEGYVASGEWRDKAGGYAIQESADRFVTALEGGGFDNVVGLPVGLALDLLAAEGHGPARVALQRYRARE